MESSESMRRRGLRTLVFLGALALWAVHYALRIFLIICLIVAVISMFNTTIYLIALYIVHGVGGMLILGAFVIFLATYRYLHRCTKYMIEYQKEYQPGID